MRVAVIGRTRMLYDTTRALAAAGHQIGLIATCRAAPEYDVKEEDFRALALELGAPFLLTQNLNSQESLLLLKQANAPIAVSVNWINVIGHEACAAFPLGILNAHAGALPRYRGNAPVAWAILQGEEQVGITIHEMAPGELDAGPILLTDTFPLLDDTYIGEVYQFLERRIPEMFVAAVEGLTSGSIRPRPQPADPSQTLRCFPRLPEDGLIDWSSSATAICRLIRATAEPFQGAFTFLRGARLTIWRGRPEAWKYPSLAVPGQVTSRRKQNGEVCIASGQGVVVLEEVQADQMGRRLPTAVIASMRDRLGTPGPI